MGVISLGELVAPENQNNLGTIVLPAQNSSDPVVLIDSLPVPVSENSDIFVPGTVESYYVHTQVAPASIWTVTHNLNKHPAIHIEDPSGNLIIAEIRYISNNQVEILFGKVYSGTAYFN
jgi:hypothetical protein